jgi:hypothetical protein
MLKDNEQRMDDELDAVVKLLAEDFPGTDDYNVCNDEEVDLFDDCGNVFKTISMETFNKYWTRMENEFDYSQYIEMGESNA